MIALARSEPSRLTPGRYHAPREEYFAWVGRVLPNPAGVKMRRYFYNRFVARWPDLDTWFAEPLLVQLDLHGRSIREIGRRTGPSHDAGSYLAYLSLVHGVAMDAAWVLSRNFDNLFDPRIATGPSPRCSFARIQPWLVWWTVISRLWVAQVGNVRSDAWWRSSSRCGYLGRWQPRTLKHC